MQSGLPSVSLIHNSLRRQPGYFSSLQTEASNFNPGPQMLASQSMPEDAPPPPLPPRQLTPAAQPPPLPPRQSHTPPPRPGRSSFHIYHYIWDTEDQHKSQTQFNNKYLGQS